MKKKAASVQHEQIRILKTGQCPSLSGKSALTYHFGCDQDSVVYLRIYANSSSGYFNKEWVSLATITEVFAKRNAERPLTSFSLNSIFQGKSANSAGFLFAALKQEGFVAALDDRRLGYEVLFPEAFMTELQSLIASNVSLDPNAKPKAAKKGPGKAAGNDS
jgi:hypothetical protein